MRAPTPEERAKETSFLYTTLADVWIVALLIIVAFASGSLTMLSEAVRSVLMIVISFYSLWLLLAVHRGRLTRFEYGVGKIEQAVWVMVGVGLVISGLWIAQTVVDTLFSSKPAASPLGLVVAAITNAINTLINVLGWHAMLTASRADDSEVFRAQLGARFTMMVSTLFLQVTLTMAALAKDDAIALALDAIGATFVSGLMLYNGVSMIAHGLPHLLDSPAPADLAALIRKAIESEVPPNSIVSIRTRRAGSTTFAEVAVAATAFPSMTALQEGTSTIATALRQQGAEVDLTVVPTSAET